MNVHNFLQLMDPCWPWQRQMCACDPRRPAAGLIEHVMLVALTMLLFSQHLFSRVRAQGELGAVHSSGSENKKKSERTAREDLR